MKFLRNWLAAGAALLGGLCGEAVPAPQAAPAGISERVEEIMARDAQVRARAASRPPRERRRLRIHPGLKPAGVVPGAPAPSIPASPKWSVAIGPKAPQALGTSFLGTQSSDNNPMGFIPLDAMGAVGPTQILLVSNVRIKVFDKTGTLGALDASVESFFGSVGGASGTTDVRARFDVFTQRWFVAALNGALASPGTSNLFMLAVSDGPTITLSTVWTFFSFTAGLRGMQADSDTVGIDVNAIYVGASEFDATGRFQGCAAFVIQKSSVLGAGPIVVASFPAICDANFVGTYLPQGVDNDDPAATLGFLVGVDLSGLNAPTTTAMGTALKVIRILNPAGTTPSIDGTFSVTVPQFGNSLGVDRSLNNLPANLSNLTAIGVPVEGCQAAPAMNPEPPAGVVVGLDDLDQRLTSGQMKNGHLFTVHNIDVDTSGNAIQLFTSGPQNGLPMSAAGRSGTRWYDIINLSTTPVLHQSGTLFDSASVASASSYFVPTLAVSGQGHVAIGATRGGPAEFAEIAVSGRLSGDPLGSLQAAAIAQTSSSAYNGDPLDPVQRWGDYSLTCVDAADDMTMWTFQEYCNAPNSMAVRVIQLKAPPPASPASTFPPSVVTGTTSFLVTVTGAAAAGSGFFDGGALYPGRLSASVSGGVVVNRVNYIDPTQVTLDLDTTGAAGPGTQTLTITNPDGQSILAPGFITLASPSATSATVTQVASKTANGVYGEGSTVTIQVGFSQSITVSGGTPTLALSSGGMATYQSGTGTATLTFSYPVAAGNTTGGAPLDVASASSLATNGATLRSGGVDANLSLPVGATALPPLSLSASANIVINTTPPLTTILTEPTNPSLILTPTFTFSSSHSGSRFETQIDGGGWLPNGTMTSIQLGALALGQHTFQVRATDALGNVDPSPPSYTWSVVAVLPPPPSGKKGHSGCGALGAEGLLVLAFLRLAARRRILHPPARKHLPRQIGQTNGEDHRGS
jgi:hypothetical protein